MHDEKPTKPRIALLLSALVAVDDEDTAYRLLTDLCTIQEIQAMAQRIQVAGMLKGGATYQDIARETGASTATISRVNRCLAYGAEGYRHILDKLKEQEGQ